ncbi:hypothetical protein KCU81_g662, partial [Aureobasidium melanogenum]
MFEASPEPNCLAQGKIRQKLQSLGPLVLSWQRRRVAKGMLSDNQPCAARNMLQAPTPWYRSDLTDKRELISQGS